MEKKVFISYSSKDESVVLFFVQTLENNGVKCWCSKKDLDALAWKDDEYNGLFENLAFQEKALSYSLAVRDEDKDLLITNRISMPGTDKIFAKLSSVFAEEYGAVVTAKLKKCVVLSGSGEENMEGILVESNECKHMGILVYVEQIGKKLNIKFYILFMPRGTRLADQKQQVLSLYKKLSPSVAMWESSMKDTVLMAIQQLLNEEPTRLFSLSGYVLKPLGQNFFHELYQYESANSIGIRQPFQQLQRRSRTFRHHSEMLRTRRSISRLFQKIRAIAHDLYDGSRALWKHPKKLLGLCPLYG